MTFSICVRERIDDEGAVLAPGDAGEDAGYRFGVAVTTRLPCVGTLCPFVSPHGAVATQGLVNVDLGRRGVAYLEDGLGVADALDALVSADDGASERQLHGVGRAGSYVFSGGECQDWFGHEDHGTFTVAGNLLTGGDVLAEVAAAYRDGDPDRDLAARLVDALAAGYAAGGDKRETLHVQSAALRVADTVDREQTPHHHDLRVDATESPVRDLRETHRMATTEFGRALDAYREENETGNGDGDEGEDAHRNGDGGEGEDAHGGGNGDESGDGHGGGNGDGNGGGDEGGDAHGESGSGGT